MRIIGNDLARFWQKVDKNGPMPEEGTLAAERGLGQCWDWTGAIQGHGYGNFWLKGKYIGAHTFLLGPPPEGMERDHLCRRKRCVRPSHVETVTHRENDLRGVGVSAIQIAKTECEAGHPFDDGDNTYTDSKGHRHCRPCRAKAQREYTARKRSRAS